ncbi:MAG: hypothetical protein Q9160_006074 [Pyrenula sp. 1 TL-2023]
MDRLDAGKSNGWQHPAARVGLQPSQVWHSTGLTDFMSLTPDRSSNPEKDWTNSDPLTFDGASNPVRKIFLNPQTSSRELGTPHFTINHRASQPPIDSDPTSPSPVNTNNADLDPPIAQLSLSSIDAFPRSPKDSSSPTTVFSNASLSPQSSHYEIRSLLKLAPSPPATPKKDLLDSHNSDRPNFSRRLPSVACRDVPDVPSVSDDLTREVASLADLRGLGLEHQHTPSNLYQKLVENNSRVQQSTQGVAKGHQVEAVVEVSPIIKEKRGFPMQVLEHVARGEANVFEEQTKRRRVKSVDTDTDGEWGSPHGIRETLHKRRKRAREDESTIDHGNGGEWNYSLPSQFEFGSATETRGPEDRESESESQTMSAPSSPIDNTSPDPLPSSISSPPSASPPPQPSPLSPILHQFAHPNPLPFPLVPPKPPPPSPSPPPQTPFVPNATLLALHEALLYAQTYALVPNKAQTHWTAEIERLHGEIRKWEEGYERGRRL